MGLRFVYTEKLNMHVGNVVDHHFAYTVEGVILVNYVGVVVYAHTEGKKLIA